MTRRRKAAAKGRPRLDDERASRSTINKGAPRRGKKIDKGRGAGLPRESRTYYWAPWASTCWRSTPCRTCPCRTRSCTAFTRGSGCSPTWPYVALAGLGIEGFVRICGRKSVPLVVVIIALQIRVGLEPHGLSPGAPGGLYSRSLGLHTAHPAHFFGDYARALLKPLPQNALLLINYDQQWTSIRSTPRGRHVCPAVSRTF